MKKMFLGDRFSAPKEIKLKSESRDVDRFEKKNISCELSDMNFKDYRPALQKPRLTDTMKSKFLSWAKNLKDKILDSWKSVCIY